MLAGTEPEGPCEPRRTVMRRVIYKMSVSLDGFIAGPGGEIDWSAPDEELHRFHNEQVREIGPTSWDGGFTKR
jgi:hypothetical protein